MVRLFLDMVYAFATSLRFIQALLYKVAIPISESYAVRAGTVLLIHLMHSGKLVKSAWVCWLP